ncbi:MAG: ABC transporter permease [Nitrososphaerota archaeon]|nr:ABC transporter permease [Nitrososphaerota archaeon]
MISSRREAVQIFLSSTVSKIGVSLLVILLAFSIYTLAAFPPDYGRLVWNNPKAWENYPKSAPPSWINVFTGFKHFEHGVLEPGKPVAFRTPDGAMKTIYHFTLEYTADEFPTFFSISLRDLRYWDVPPILTVRLVRPDGKAINLMSFAAPPPRDGEKPPYTRFVEEPLTIKIDSDVNVWRSVSAFLKENYGIELSPSKIGENPGQYLFGSPIEGNFSKPMKGEYSFEVVATLHDERDSLGHVSLILGGSVYGLLGTDVIGRDIAIGVLLGFPISLFIGIITSVAVTLIGGLLGIVSGYIGGKTDEVIQRISDVVYNLPLLPLTIFLIFLMGSSIWNIILLLIVFGWPGLTILARSIALQLRESQFIEASRTFGSSAWRIIFKHMLPQVTPFIVAEMIFFVPTFILLEAALSFLGLGDPSLPTWGQMLELGFRNGAIYLGLWWWIIPPGLMIVLTAFTFVLIALGMEPVVNPRLRTG